MIDYKMFHVVNKVLNVSTSKTRWLFYGGLRNNEAMRNPFLQVWQGEIIQFQVLYKNKTLENNGSWRKVFYTPIVTKIFLS